MTPPKKLTRDEVYKQIDTFRGIAGRVGNGKPLPEQWVAEKSVVNEPPPRPTRNGKP